MNIKYTKFVSLIIAFICLLSFTSNVNAESYTKDLTVGSTGAEVEALQNQLIEDGYLKMPEGTAKGYFGSMTQAALAKYQKSIGFPAYGYFGRMSREHFNKKGNTNALNVISPNGGENWQKGTYQNIKWNAPQYIKATNVDIILSKYDQPCISNQHTLCPAFMPIALDYIIVKNVNANDKIYSWKVGDTYSTGYNPIDMRSTLEFPYADSQYTIKICESGTNVCARSNKPFTITSASTTVAQIKVISPNGGEKWDIGATNQIRWTSTLSNNIDIFLTSSPCRMTSTYYVADSGCSNRTYILDKNISSNAIYNWISGTDIDNKFIPAGDYRVTICSAGTGNCDTSDNPFTLNSNLLRICPTEKIINGMPSIGTSTIPTRYYILFGQRKEISEFDATWVANNCSVKEKTAY